VEKKIKNSVKYGNKKYIEKCDKLIYIMRVSFHCPISSRLTKITQKSFKQES
jgi:hypothetical protein